MQKKQNALKLAQRPCVDVLAGVQLGLLLVYNSVVVKARSLNLLYLKTWKEDWLYKKKKQKREIGTQWLFVETATLKTAQWIPKDLSYSQNKDIS